MAEQPNPSCPHCRISVAIQKWMDDPAGAAARVVEARKAYPAMLDGEESIVMKQLAFGLGEVLADVINSAAKQGLDVATMMNCFKQSFNEGTTSTEIPCRWVPNTGEGPLN